MSLLLAFFVFTWLPVLFNTSGLSIQQSVFASTMLPVGAVAGSLLWGRLVDKTFPTIVLGSAYALYAICLIGIGLFGSSYQILLLLLFVGGAGSGAQTSTNAFIAGIHPTLVRSTAVGWALGIGRIGSILGPLLGTFLVGWPLNSVFYLMAAPAAIAAVSMWLIGKTRTEITAVSPA
jgi:AAHS family 4-hydroxybenzoate transporter-like MFS transporter